MNVKMRNFDVGLDDGHITPTLLPGVTECPNVEPTPYPVPTLDAVTRHGFTMKIQTRSREWKGTRSSWSCSAIDVTGESIRRFTFLASSSTRQNAIDKYGYMVEPETSRAYARR